MRLSISTALVPAPPQGAPDELSDRLARARVAGVMACVKDATALVADVDDKCGKHDEALADYQEKGKLVSSHVADYRYRPALVGLIDRFNEARLDAVGSLSLVTLGLSFLRITEPEIVPCLTFKKAG